MADQTEAALTWNDPPDPSEPVHVYSLRITGAPPQSIGVTDEDGTHAVFERVSPEKEAAIEGLVKALRGMVMSINYEHDGQADDLYGVTSAREALAAAAAAGLTKGLDTPGSGR